jgi:hypothetical protein
LAIRSGQDLALELPEAFSPANCKVPTADSFPPMNLAWLHVAMVDAGVIAVARRAKVDIPRARRRASSRR